MDKRTEVQVNEIIDELGYLALAISIAGTYISQTPRLMSDLSKYLEEYHRRRHVLLAKQPDELLDKYGHSVMTVWETSYSAVEEQLPRACQLLTLLAFIDYEDIFLDLFGLDNVSDATMAAKPWMSVWDDHHLDLDMLEKCFAILERYSLVQRQSDQTSYTMHRLVQAWDHDRLFVEPSKMREYCLAAFEMVYEAMVECADLPESKLRLVPHLRSSVNKAMQVGLVSGTGDIEILNMIEHVGVFATEIGSWKEAAAMKKEVLEKRKRILGDEHPDTIRSMNNLASTLADQGKLDKAAQMFFEVLEKTKRILGDEHPSTISAMHNLATTLGDQGKLDKAAQMKKEVLEKMKRILGDEHPSTIIAMNNLAFMLGDQGKLDEAARVFQGALEMTEHALGMDHPTTTMIRNNVSTISSMVSRCATQAVTEDSQHS